MVKPYRWPRALGVAALVVVSLAVGAPPASAIYNGPNAPVSSYRFMVSLRMASAPGAHVCGGTLIAPDIVLTAAHCTRGGALVAVVGPDTSQRARAPRVAVIDHLEPATYDAHHTNRDDIALVRLAVPQASTVISLARFEPRANARVVTAGWGCTNKPPACSTYPSTLKVSHQIVLRDGDCGTGVFWNPRVFAPTSICTRNAKSTVNLGDSGGPLLILDGKGGFTQVGLTSLVTDNPKVLGGAFTSIPAERAWISEAIRLLRRR
jgi:trypsin